MIYLDHNATTPADECVLDAMMPFQTSCYGNPSGLYQIGRISRDAIETARGQVAALVGVQPSEVIFTSGGTEANNLALKGAAATLGAGTIALGATEHPSVVEPLKFLNQSGWKIATIPVLSDGTIAADAIEQVLTDRDLKLVTLMTANNETGVIHNLHCHIDRLKAHGVVVHTDAVQAAGKIPVDFHGIGAHLMSLSAHKLYGPKGAGALIKEKSLQLAPLVHGGGQEMGLRAGTENVAAIVGFGKAAELAMNTLSDRQLTLLRLREQLEVGVEKITGLTIFGKTAHRLPNTVQFGVPGIDGEMLLMELDRHGIAVSSGSACSSGGREPSHVLLAMGVEESLAQSAVRVSLGVANSGHDVETFLSMLEKVISRLTHSSPLVMNG